jgi:hypothetical protein
MTQAVTLLLLFAFAPTRAERALLEAYAGQQRLALVAPAPTPAPPFPPYRTELVLDIEGRLDQARMLASSLDEERALAALASIERDLFAHPELPQAAWLLAEHHRIAAEVRRADPAFAAEADALSRAARVLEGPRAPAFGETLATASESGPSVRFLVRDLAPRDTLEIDGQGGGAERQLVPGVHHLRVLRDDRLVHAAWARVGKHVEVVLGVRPIAACSEEELAPTRASATTALPPRGVACERWLAVRRAPGGLELASCQKSACSSFQPLVVEDPTRGVPPWAVAATGLGAMAATLLTVWATGGFDPEPAPPGRTVFVYGGLR